MSAREEILSRIRAAVGKQMDDYAAVPRHYRQSPSMSAGERIELFIDRLEDYDATVHRVAEAGIAGVIGRSLSNRRLTRIVVPVDIPQAWLPSGFDFIPDRNLSYGDLDGAEGVVTACELAIALTGTIVLQNAPGQGRRALTLIPDYYLCVVREEQIVETVPEGIRALAKAGARATTFISGPSATSDIEMTRIKGVHGPRTLEIVLVTSAS